MKSGSAMETTACRLKVGVTHSIGGVSDCATLSRAPAGISTPKIITSTKAASAAGTAKSRLKAPTTIQARMMGRPSAGLKPIALIGA